MAFLKWLKKPFVKIKRANSTGLDGVTRSVATWIGIFWFSKRFGFITDYYDGPIYTIAFGIAEIYWHTSVGNPIETK